MNQGEVAMAAAWDDDTSIALAKGTLFKRAKLYIPSHGPARRRRHASAFPPTRRNKAAALLFISYLTEADDAEAVERRPRQLSLPAPTSPARTRCCRRKQRQKNGVARLPGPYKKYYIEQFVSQVLQQ